MTENCDIKDCEEKSVFILRRKVFTIYRLCGEHFRKYVNIVELSRLKKDYKEEFEDKLK